MSDDDRFKAVRKLTPQEQRAFMKQLKAYMKRMKGKDKGPSRSQIQAMIRVAKKMVRGYKKAAPSDKRKEGAKKAAATRKANADFKALAAAFPASAHITIESDDYSRPPYPVSIYVKGHSSTYAHQDFYDYNKALEWAKSELRKLGGGIIYDSSLGYRWGTKRIVVHAHSADPRRRKRPSAKGLAARRHKKPSDFPAKLLARGTRIEMREHGVSARMARRIAMDHLTENPRAYSKKG